jgi:NAD-dependent SIR2 family protein deacetylase
MITYHGLMKAECVSCNWNTRDAFTIETLNDLESMCPKCSGLTIVYTDINGSTIEGNK